MKKYDPSTIEKKWQKYWETEKLFVTKDHVEGEENFYKLVEFPYPSGNLHMGHWYSYSVPDIYARYKKMRGYNVLYPFGYDAFGLPAENAAIKNNVQPADWTKKNIATMTKQMKSMGAMFDWSRMVSTIDPDYYRWTQWIFLQFYKAGLAYRAKTLVNWCPKDKTVLANEQVLDGKCDRCGSDVEQREREQWMYKITKYADQLLEGLDRVDWPEVTKTAQKNWIGKSEGAEISFRLTDIAGQEDEKHSVTVFTTRPDTIFGATFLVISPELAKKWLVVGWKSSEPVMRYIETALKKRELDRMEEKEKTGIFAEIYAINPANQERIPVWIADYVLGSYGTGAIMAVPAHDERDFEFAKKYSLPIREVVVQKFGEERKDAVRRDGVAAVVTRPSDNKVLVLWNRATNEWRLVSGGYDEGEGDIETLKREMREETGYINFEIKEYIGQIFTNYFVPERNVYRTRYHKGYHVHLLSGEAIPQKPDGFEDFELHWLDPQDAIVKKDSIINQDNEAEFIKRFVNPKLQCYTGEGRLVNSGVFDGMDSEQAKWKIVKSLNQESNTTVLIVHGCPGDKESTMDLSRRSYDKHWMPWTRSQLDSLGVPAEIILMPQPWAPSYEVWKKEFEKQKITEDTILIGHSCGCAFLTHWLGETKIKIKALILVAPWKVIADKHTITPERQGVFEKFYGFEIDPSIKERVGTILYFTSDTERKGGKESLEIYHNALGGRIISIPNRGHFITEDMKTDEFPELLQESGKYIVAQKKATYRLRDWILSRQRYWGTPIPMIVCEKCGYQPVAEEELPVKLPKLENYLPADDGSSPLARAEKWVKTKCPNCGGKAKRETDTMDVFLDSSWYYLRYPSMHAEDAKTGKVPWNKELTKQWLPVDLYTGGPEHNTMHLLYSRFFIKALHELGLVDFDEPFTMRRNHGIVLGPNGQKMSKSKGNVIDPDKEVAQYGADTVRMFLAFLGPYDTFNGPWDPRGIVGVRRFLDRVWKLADRCSANRVTQNVRSEIDKKLHQAIKKIGEDIEKLHFNTAISESMKLLNEFESSSSQLTADNLELFLKLLAPFAPHITEELWQNLRQSASSPRDSASIHLESWPIYDPALIKEDTVTIAVQVGGKTRATIQVPTDSTEEVIAETAKTDTRVEKHLSGQAIKKTIFVKNKLINFVV
ncbi:MAG: hypothetical protein A3A33_03650 [Candidatus Yanofskybacteria bacterium RIFCSPLOWO2_01_FULL_49_25]|uniref:Leucine--tRNA ligase n=1 Tax=Candidatus Yanofskybacteria bacterium RIFCSPLOWO2_01_FULL_49_25 TaxID=1802701 RepID=A0A1F8GXA0_9BACT|nr:MAG: hypothetical protein A3A33_03650 [Candidatus Yanofskybacteria bacterium RIFCSPLOWO2_01_FULL_49_25]